MIMREDFESYKKIVKTLLDKSIKCKIALHTDNPINFQESKEAAYQGYHRIVVDEWEYDTNKRIYNKKRVMFPECTGGSEVIKYFSVSDSFNSSRILFAGAFGFSMYITSGTIFSVPTGVLSCVWRGKASEEKNINTDYSICIKCGYINEYIEKTNDYVCYGCKTW